MTSSEYFLEKSRTTAYSQSKLLNPDLKDKKKH